MQNFMIDTKVEVHTYKNLTKLSKEEVISLLQYLVEGVNKKFIMLGGLLYIIRKNKWYAPSQSFMEFCDVSPGIQYRKAMYLIQIYEALIDSHVSFNDVACLPYTKLVLVAPHFTQDNHKSLIAWADGLTTQQIEEELKTMAQKSKDFFNKISETKVLDPQYTETSKTKINKQDLSNLKNLLIVTPVTMVVDALRIIYPTKEFTLV